MYHITHERLIVAILHWTDRSAVPLRLCRFMHLLCCTSAAHLRHATRFFSCSHPLVLALALDKIMGAKGRGLFVAIEGLDRAGKSTQVARLAEVLGCKAMKFPDRTTAIGKMIDSYLLNKSEVDDRAIHLLFSANRWEAKRAIMARLESGENVVCDRYAFSGIAYSCAKGLDYEWCRAPDIGLPAPDLTIFLHLSPEEAAKRGGYGEERYEKVEIQTKVRKAFSQISEEMAGKKWLTIDAGKSVEEVAADCTEAAQVALKAIESSQEAVGSLFTSKT